MAALSALTAQKGKKPTATAMPAGSAGLAPSPSMPKPTPIAQPLTPAGSPSAWGPSTPSIGVGSGGDPTLTNQTQFNLGRNTGMDGLDMGPTPYYGIDPNPSWRPSPTAAPPLTTPGIDTSDLGSLLEQFKPEAVPREPGLKTLPRETGAGPEDRTAAESAAFGRAAERIGRVGAGSLRALKASMTRRGISGSGLEAKGETAIRNATQGQLGEVIRDQAIEGLDREQEINDRDLAAAISQRGQDLGIAGTNYTGGISQRGQDLSQSDWKLSALPSILTLLKMRGSPQVMA